MPGRLANRASNGCQGEGKTDARDAYMIAGQARIRRGLRLIRPGDDAAHRAEAADRPPRRSGRGPHPLGQPPVRHSAVDVPGPGAGPGGDERRLSQAADGLPESSLDPPGRHRATDKVAGQPTARSEASEPRQRQRSRPPSGWTASSVRPPVSGTVECRPTQTLTTPRQKPQ